MKMLRAQYSLKLFLAMITFVAFASALFKVCLIHRRANQDVFSAQLEAERLRLVKQSNYRQKMAKAYKESSQVQAYFNSRVQQASRPKVPVETVSLPPKPREILIRMHGIPVAGAPSDISILPPTNQLEADWDHLAYERAYGTKTPHPCIVAAGYCFRFCFIIRHFKLKPPAGIHSVRCMRSLKKIHRSLGELHILGTHMYKLSREEIVDLIEACIPLNQREVNVKVERLLFPVGPWTLEDSAS